jgi:hypothetical protein
MRTRQIGCTATREGVATDAAQQKKAGAKPAFSQFETLSSG